MSSLQIIRESDCILWVGMAYYSRIEKSVHEKHKTPGSSIIWKQIYYVMNTGLFLYL